MFRLGAAGSRGGRRAVDCDMIVVVIDIDVVDDFCVDGCKRDQKSEGAHVSNGQNENENEAADSLQNELQDLCVVATMCATYLACITASNGREGDVCT